MTTPLANAIAAYIASLAGRKLEAHDKKTEKDIKKLEDSKHTNHRTERLQSRRALERSFEPALWLERAADRAGQITLATHAIKFSHSDARGSSPMAEFSRPDPALLATHSLHAPTVDVAGNAAALDVANLLLLEADGHALWQRLQSDDTRDLAPFARDSEQAEAWCRAFNAAFSATGFQTHSLAKQVYWPVGEGYHLISPLFASSLAQAIWQRVDNARFADDAKTARERRRQGKGCRTDIRVYPGIAAMNFGGSKPQNVSLLNSRRRGRSYLLPSRPPTWTEQLRLPDNSRQFWRLLGRRSQPQVNALRQFLADHTELNDTDIRRRRAELVNDITDQFFELAARLRQIGEPGWSRDTALSLAEQCLLDPRRNDADIGTPDSPFQSARDDKSWREAISGDYGQWLNRRLHRIRTADGRRLRELGDPEAKEWVGEVQGTLSRVRDSLEAWL